MGVSFDPFVETAVTMADLNMRHQQQEDYFLELLGAGTATQQAIEAEAGEGLADRATAYLDLSDNMIYEMDSDASGPRAGTIRGFIDGAVLTGETARLVIGGLLNGFTGLSDFAPVYVGSTVGSVTQTRPIPALAGSQIMIAEMGFATASDTVFVRPRPIQYQKRKALSDNETISISHHPDAEGYLRKLAAYYKEAEAGASITSYASGNQDSNMALSDATPNYSADLCTGGTPIGNMTGGDNLAGAFDNNVATRCQGAGTTGTIGYDFGSNKTIRQYTVRETTAAASTTAPNAWTFQYSPDNSNWTTVDTRSSQSAWSDGETRTYQFANTVAARYWRLNISNNNGGANTNIGEVEMMDVSSVTGGFSKLAQTFNLAGSEDIGAVGLWLKKVGSPTGTVTVRIETVSGGDPTGTLAHADASVTFEEASLGTSYAEKVVSFANSFTLGAADYAIVISTSRSASETDYIHWGADGSSPGYAGGNMRQYSGSWAAASKDAVFAVYEPGLTHPQAVAVDWWESTHADLVNRYGDGSGADLTTKTTFKNLRDAGFSDITLVVEVA
jgi:hypothetical protein